MCFTDRHDMTLAVKVALNPIQPTLQNYKILDLAKLKGLADDKINVTEKKMELTLAKVGNNVGKEKMMITSIFSSSKNVFKCSLFQGYKNLGLCGKGLKN